MSSNVYGPKILRYLSIVEGVADRDMAAICGYNYSTYRQSILTGKTILSLDSYFLLQNKYGFNFDAIQTGEFEYPYFFPSNPFRIPEKYIQDAYSGGRISRLYIHEFIKTYSIESFEEYCIREKVNPLYFFNRLAPINMRFIQGLLQGIAIKDREKLYSISSLLSRELDAVGVAGEGLERVESAMHKIVLLEKNHSYRVEEVGQTKLVFSFRPNEHIDIKLWASDPLIGGFVSNHMLATVKNVAGSDCEAKLLKRESGERGRNYIEVIKT